MRMTEATFLRAVEPAAQATRTHEDQQHRAQTQVINHGTWGQLLTLDGLRQPVRPTLADLNCRNYRPRQRQRVPLEP